MKIRRISIYKEFKCMGPDCPVNCCKGWRVPLDYAACEKYYMEREKFGARIRFFIKKGEDIPTFRSICGRCPFWGKDRLCGLQRDHGEEYMPQVCRQFPRSLDNYGLFCEETLYLACPASAGLFLKHAKQGEHFAFEETEGGVTYKVNTVNDDQEFLDYLLTARKELTRLLGNGLHYDSMAILQYGKEAKACRNGGCGSETSEIQEKLNAGLNDGKLPEPLEYIGRNAYPCGGSSSDMQEEPVGKTYQNKKKSSSDTGIEDAAGSRLELDCSDLNELFFNGFYHPYLLMNLPFLHGLCWKYLWKLGILCKVAPKAANRKLASLKENLYKKIPKLDMFFDRYYEYYLQMEFLDVLEDYEFTNRLLYGMAKINMLQVLIAIYMKDKQSISDEELAKIIAIYERRAPQMRRAVEKVMPNLKL